MTTHASQLVCLLASRVALSTIVVCLASTSVQPVFAQDSSPDGDIVVTARKRDETSIAVPVALTAVSSAEIERRAVSSFDSLSKLVPQLIVGDAAGSVQGGNIVIRGVSSADGNLLADQAVSFNIDGAQVARSSIRRMAQMDMAQIEVLKGPQALFFGKNSPGGIISIRTADPTPNFEVKASLGYEFVGREIIGEGYISGPLTDTLGARLAFYGSRLSGWVKNTAATTGPFAPARERYPFNRDIAARLTLKFEPSDRFDARFKLNYGRLRTAGPSQNLQRVYCATGVAQLGDADDCRADNRVNHPGFGPTFAVLDKEYGDGAPYLKQDQILASLEINYKLSDSLNLTSLSSLYHLALDMAENFSGTATPARVLASSLHPNITERSQELRLGSNFDGPINFLVGGMYQDSKIRYKAIDGLNAITPSALTNINVKHDGEAWSVFGQLRWNILETLELSGGGRYSHEKKVFRGFRRGTGEPIPPAVPGGKSWNDFSPEATLSWRPSNRLTVYGAYKEGFLSGGFNSGGGTGPAFDQQKTKGFEGGIKAALLDNTLRVNLALYNYETQGLQVSTVNFTTVVVTNAGKSRAKGAELDFRWKTPIDGLTLSGAVAYNHARYKIFNVACYPGQTVALGCNLFPDLSGVYQRQDRAGDQILFAPDWSGNIGAVFETPVSDTTSIGLSADGAYTSAFDTDPTGFFAGRQKAYWLLDAAIRIFDNDRKWEAALIGKNLTNKYYFTRSTSNTFTGSGTGTTSGVFGDQAAAVSRGREFLLRLTYNFR